MENENFDENVVEDFNEVANDINVDTSLQEVESNLTDTQNEFISTLLSIVEERMNEDEEEGSALIAPSEQSETGAISAEPVLVSVDNENDYSDLLVSINEKLDLIVSSNNEILVDVAPHDISTPLNEYTFIEFGLVAVLVMLFSLGALKIIKSFVFHLN